MFKRLFFVLLLSVLFSDKLTAKTFSVNGTLIEGEVIVASSSCVIIESYDPAGNPLFWVLSEVANIFLPKTINYVCLKILGEDRQEICNSIANSIDFLTTVAGTGKKTYRLLRDAIECTAEKGMSRSSLCFFTQSLDVAYNIKSTLEAYKKMSIVEWENIQGNYDLNSNYYPGNVKIENRTSQSFTLSLSKDGVNWYYNTINAGKFEEIQFWKGYEKQSYGFCKGNNICNYQLFTGKSYRIRYDKQLKGFYLEEI